jgi:hypothetical protein
LKKDHGWTAPKGYQVLVVDKGAVHICFPSGWVANPTDISMRLSDVEPPDDSCRIEVSYVYLDRRISDESFSLEQAMKVICKTKAIDDVEYFDWKEPVFLRRDDFRLAWVERKHTDPTFFRPVISRSLIGVGNGVYLMITYNCWADDVLKFNPVWQTMLDTLKLGHYMPDPSTGRTYIPRLN